MNNTPGKRALQGALFLFSLVVENDKQLVTKKFVVQDGCCYRYVFYIV
ncbi:MAG: hypothetical protein K0S33_1149 [Bacteroidetes bacterium]|jgi:hypothetical protein|nr:hypothetical protein [Bacteroidota bacterium]